MSEADDHGITVTEIAAMDQPIDVSPETTAAFVGRALRGPLNAPVLVQNFAEFRRRFGDIWNRSSLGPAVQQFFSHGGKRLYIVRVANGARGALICLPASGSALVLRAVEPGSTELIRAAVDYDGIGDDELFNLTLQRVNPATQMVVDQELFARLSYREESDDFVGDALLTSMLARVEHPFPTHRPEATLRRYGKTEDPEKPLLPVFFDQGTFPLSDDPLLQSGSPVVATGQQSITCRCANGTRRVRIEKGKSFIGHFLQKRRSNFAVRVGR